MKKIFTLKYIVLLLTFGIAFIKSKAQVTHLVISQVYGGAGCLTAGCSVYQNDFIEIFNPGSTPQSLNGWSVQYASATGTSWQVTALTNVTLQPGQYYLVAESFGANGINPLPTPDVTGTIAMSATAGKVVLVNSTTALSGACPLPNAAIIDLAGYGSTPDCNETANAPAPGTTTSDIRKNGGCTDTDDNSSDFQPLTPAPRNSSSPIHVCMVVCAPTYTIAQVQGSGNTSPLTGLSVTINGIVTGLKVNGFFMQTPDANTDADPNTSEGIFVFTGGAPTASAATGNSVCVTGTVTEFIPFSDLNSPSMTEITLPAVTLLSTGNSLPVVITLTVTATDPAGSIYQLEKYEGMRVQVSSLTVAGSAQGISDEPNATATSTGYFYGVITGIARPFREPGVQQPDPLPPGAPANVPRWDANPEIIGIDSKAQPGSATINVATGAVLANTIGPLDFVRRFYTIDVDVSPAPVVSNNNLTFTPASSAANSEVTVASLNLQRFFDTVDDPAIADAVLTSTAFNNRLNKVSLAIRNVLNFPDITGVQEVENFTSLQAIATKVNNDAVAASQPNPNYQAYLTEGNDITGIDVGFLVKSAKINVVDVTQFGKTATYINPATSALEILFDRPPLLLRATFIKPGCATPIPFTIIVNHFRTLSGIDDATNGNSVRTRRRAQAEFLATFIQGRQISDPTEKIISVGDYNTYQFNDGYVDVMGTIKGTPVSSDQVVLASSDLVNPDLTNLADAYTANQKYTLSSGGSASSLDHVLVTQNISSQVSGFTIARLGADFPEIYRNDPNRPERITDHDVPVAYFAFTCLSPLPVVFILFNARCENSKVMMTWKTAQEFNSSYFDIERNTDGSQWTVIGSLPAAGNSNTERSYTFLDNSPSPGAIYHIAGHDIDGRVKYTSIIRSDCDTKNGWKVWPNPVTENLWVTINTSVESKVIIKVFDSKGALISLQQNNLLRGNNLLNVDMKKMAAGTYQILTNWGDGQMQKTVQIVKM